MYSRLRSKIPLWLLLSGFLALQACTVFTPGLISANIQRERQFRKEIIAYSQKYLGLPYRYASRDPEVGFDCSGFTHFVMKNFDIALSTSSSAQSLEGIKVPLEEVQPGDLVFSATAPGEGFFMSRSSFPMKKKGSISSMPLSGGL